MAYFSLLPLTLIFERPSHGLVKGRQSQLNFSFLFACFLLRLTFDDNPSYRAVPHLPRFTSSSPQSLRNGFGFPFQLFLYDGSSFPSCVLLGSRPLFLGSHLHFRTSGRSLRLTYYQQGLTASWTGTTARDLNLKLLKIHQGRQEINHGSHVDVFLGVLLTSSGS